MYGVIDDESEPGSWARELELREAMRDGDAVNSPRHYTSHPARCKCGNRIECIQITEHMGFCLGNAVKYIWRAGLKADAIEDLRKSLWYIQREIDRRLRSAEREEPYGD